MKRNIVILTVLFIFCITLPVFALDAKIYPGSMGIRFSGSTAPLPRLSHSAQYNPGSVWLYLDLPVVRDNTGGNIQSGWVKVQDRHYSYNVSSALCCRYMGRNGSWYGSTSARKYSSGSNVAPQTLSFGFQRNYSGAHIYFNLMLPPVYSGNRSGVISYSVTEY